MNKLLLLSGLAAGLVLSSAAQAQSYNPNYPSQVGASYYNSRRPAASSNGLKKFSIGMDYVIGSTSVADKNFIMKSPLTGGNDYTGSTEDFEDKIDVLSGNAGVRPFKYFGVEGFYQQSLSDNQIKYQEHYSGSDKFAQAEYNIEYKAYGLDAIFYLPVASRFELMVTGGIANYDISAEAKLNGYSENSLNMVSGSKVKFDENKTVFRYGAGAQFWMTRRLNFRLMYRHIPLDGDFMEDIDELSFGVRYNF